MSKKDGINDKVNTITGKTNPDNSPNNNDIHKHYEKALTTSPASRRDPSNARALVVPPKTQKEVTKKKVKERAQKRANRDNRLRQNRKDSLNNDNNYNNDDDDILNENQQPKTLIPNIDANSQSNDDQQQKDNNQSKTDTHSHIDDTHHQGQLYSDILPDAKQKKLNKNSKEYLEFLKNFVNHFDEIPPNEVIIQKAMVQDTIGQMFDNFLEGMNSFDKTTKQHQTFGQAAHLCQKILISLKHDDMPTANALIKRLIPKSKG